MYLADFLGWWYSRGWAWATRQFFVVYIGKLADFFSISELLKTLFAPFRQDSLQTKGAPISIKLQVLGGNIISRIFGFIIRLILISVGVIALLVCMMVGGLVLAVWPFVPMSIVIFPIILMVVQ